MKFGNIFKDNFVASTIFFYTGLENLRARFFVYVKVSLRTRLYVAIWYLLKMDTVTRVRNSCTKSLVYEWALPTLQTEHISLIFIDLLLQTFTKLFPPIYKELALLHKGFY